MTNIINLQYFVKLNQYLNHCTIDYLPAIISIRTHSILRSPFNNSTMHLGATKPFPKILFSAPNLNKIISSDHKSASSDGLSTNVKVVVTLVKTSHFSDILKPMLSKKNLQRAYMSSVEDKDMLTRVFFILRDRFFLGVVLGISRALAPITSLTVIAFLRLLLDTEIPRRW